MAKHTADYRIGYNRNHFAFYVDTSYHGWRN